MVVRLSCLSNLGTSHTFYELVLGNSTITDIASALGIKPPSVVEQIIRLQNAGIVRPGKKLGKFQHYEVDWEKFAVIFLERAPRITRMKILMKRQLRDNRYFHVLLTEYIRNYARFYKRGYKKRTISSAIEEFEEALIRIFETLKMENEIRDESKQSLVTALKEWNRNSSRVFMQPQDALLHAFKEMNLVKAVS